MDIVLRQGSTGVVEIIPQEDGSIIIRVNEGAQVKQNYGSKENKPSNFKLHDGSNKPNLEVLRDFCSGKKTEQGVDTKELKAFFEFYSVKAEEWKGKLQPEKLWERWLQTSVSNNFKRQYQQ